MFRSRQLRTACLTGLLCLIGHWPAGAATAPPAYSPESGAPLLESFSPNDYNGAVQNWAVVQDHRGVVYVGNVEDGVLEFDGIRWRRIATTNKTTVRSLAVGSDGRIYVGAVGELGYLAPDALGQMRYVSLMERIAARDRDFADVWRTFAAADGVYFSTFKRLIRFGTDGGVRVWNAANTFHLSFLVRDTLFVRETGRGLLRLTNDELVPVPQGDRFATEKIYAMLPWPAADAGRSLALLIGTRTQGWFIWEHGALRPWVTQADAAIQQGLLYKAVWLRDGTLAAGTLRDGVFVLSDTGAMLAHIDKSSGLQDNTVFDLFQDRQGGLWLGQDAGIARVDVSAPLTRYSQRSGIDGAVIDIKRHAGSLYAGTTQGLYRLASVPGQSPRFEHVPGVSEQAWSFLSFDDTLLVCGIQGVYEVQAGAAHLIRPSAQASFSLLRSTRDPSRVFVGMQNGVGYLRRVGRRWVDEGQLPGLSDEVRTMFEDRDGQLWLGTVSTGVVRVRFADEKAHSATGLAPQVTHFGMEHGLPRSPNFVYELHGEPSFATTRGIFRFDPTRDSFYADRRFAHLFAGEARQVFPIKEDARGRVWMYTSNESKTIREAGAAVPLPDGTYRWEPQSLRQAAGSAISVIHGDPDGVMWFGGDDSIFRYDPRLSTDYKKPFSALVRAVLGRNGDVVFGGAGRGASPKLEFAENALRFEFAAPSFGVQPNRFQVYLQGADRGWSSWTTEAYRDYTNIREGSYRFRVRAMNEFGTVSEEDSYALRILPPWYRTWLAYLGYAVLAVVVFAAVSRWRSAALRSRNVALAELIAQRTKELSEANLALQAANGALTERSVTDTLTGLKNRRYLLEHIEHDVAAVRRVYQRLHADPSWPAHGNADLLFLMIDIDHFKPINDRHGHVAGDRVIQQFAHILRGACREADTPVRWGGEEFLVVARFVERDAGIHFAERIRALVEAQVFDLGDGQELKITCSIGFAAYPVFPAAPERFGWEDVVNLADQCLYVAKRDGRNTWVGVRATGRAPLVRSGAGIFSDLTELIAQGCVGLHRKVPAAPRRAAEYAQVLP